MIDSAGPPHVTITSMPPSLVSADVAPSDFPVSGCSIGASRFIGDNLSSRDTFHYPLLDQGHSKIPGRESFEEMVHESVLIRALATNASDDV